jgi:serine O-acetyltransferase
MLYIYRLSNWAYRRGIPVMPRLLYALNRILFAVVLPPGVQVGKDVLFGYSGLGIVIHARCKIGNRVKIGTNVTLGGRGDIYEVPTIEDDVIIGTGAKVLGSVVIGRGARIGANAVVLSNVAPGTTVVGIPARAIK